MSNFANDYYIASENNVYKYEEIYTDLSYHLL